MTTTAGISAKRTLILLFMLSSLYLMAQKAPHEFSVNAGAGVSTYAFSPIQKGGKSLGYNFDFGFGFTGFLSKQIGIHVGAGLGQLNVKSKVNELFTITKGLYEVDDNGNDLPYELHTKLIGYADMHKTLYINIPLMLHFQSIQKQYWSWKRTQKAGFYAMGGIKLLLLFNNQYEAKIDTMYNKAYYPSLNNWADTQTFKGFGKFTGEVCKGNFDFGLLATFSLEAGVKWRIENNMFIYTGVFFDCGLNDPIKESRKAYGNYKDGLDAKKLLEDIPILKYSERANLMMVGIKIHMAFSRKARPW